MKQMRNLTDDNPFVGLRVKVVFLKIYSAFNVLIKVDLTVMRIIKLNLFPVPVN